jgi:chromosome segregation ATPase
MEYTVMCDATAKVTFNHHKSRRITKLGCCVTDKSQGKSITVDLTLAIFGVLLAVTAVASYEYYRQIRKVQQQYEATVQEYEKTHHQYEQSYLQYQQSLQEYAKAKDFLGDIVLSFGRELRRESDKFDGMVSKVEGSYATADASYRKAERLEKMIEPIETQLIAITQTQQELTYNITANLAENIQNNTAVKTELTREMSTLQAKLQELITAQETIKAKIAGLDEQVQKLSVAPPQVQEVREIMLPVVPIKRDKALAALTETEIVVLEMLSKEGGKTAPEIKERVGLSREHTARLMKKIYEEGYVEREAGKIPFRYTIKKEMEALLQKIEPTPSSPAPPPA